MKNDITKYTFSASDNLFFDANILVYLDGPIASVDQNLQDIYNVAYTKMRKAKSRLFVDIVVLSEFANRYLRLAFNPYFKSRAYGTFKEFRNSKHGKATISNICTLMKKRLRTFSLSCSHGDNAWALERLDEFNKLSGDFNDCIIADTCRINGFSLITHDKDMGNFGISIISANPNLYARTL